MLRARLIIRDWPLPGGEPLCDDPRGSYRCQVVRVGTPGRMIAGRRKDQRGQCQRTEDEQHQPKKSGREDVQHPQNDGRSRNDECDSGEHCPEGCAERHPFGDHWNHRPDGGQVREAEIDRAKPERPTNERGRSLRK